jgi:hypothetical protein
MDERGRDDIVREPNPDEADNLVPARGILVSALAAIAIWLVVVGVMLLASRPAGSMFTQLAFDVQ